MTHPDVFPSSPPPALICLLAGHSSRMGSPKQHVLLGGRTFLEHLLSRVDILQHALGKRLFVGQDRDISSRSLVTAAGGIWVVNHHPDDGPLSSIRLALERLPEPTGFLLWPIDHPLVAPETVSGILAAAAREPDFIVAPSDGTRRGHPSFFPAWAREELFAAPLEAGARWVMHRHPDRIRHVLTCDPWIRRNLNTPELLAEAARELEDR
ncbi:MAG TPA: nucleotidyltransferase family protein [Candidatus Ozemobacteraceae bacterium]|nr:nucleotidyltransferase family protein [Candidatus Ozemobacteraceae bacterium]